jgi:hypothetical protein
MADEIRQSTSASGKMSSPGPFLAKIISHLDPTYMGSLEVQILHEVGNDEAKSGQLHVVKYLSPFAGQTSVDYLGEDPNDYNNTQKSYGMWMIPPDVGTIVVVIFIDGDPRKGYWIGCVQDNVMNFSVPGQAATTFHEDGIEERVPVAEYNKKTQPPVIDPTQILKPASPLQEVFQQQGLLKDDTRGITTSSARREIPSSVFGISTPGPIDKRSGAKKGQIGKSEHKIAAGFVSRLGGTTFVMDDGDDKFLRKSSASEGPPDYAAVEQDEPDGLPDIPHNELVRIRTRTGHQILLHNSEDLIYIGNARGTTWIELTSNGKIDIYAEDSISIRTKQDFNFYADRDVNIEAGRSVNIKAGSNFHAEAGSEYRISAGADGKLTAGGTTHIKSSGQHIETASQIHMNGPEASAVESLAVFSNPDNEENVTNSIMLRVPSHEPWPHHENLDPERFTSANTDRNASSSIPAPVSWKEYSTKTDTFAKIKGSEE